MRIAPIRNIIKRPVTFGEGNMNNITQKVGSLSVQNNDKLNFERNLALTQKADAVQSSPLKAIGNKFVKAYNILFSPKHEVSYVHIPYMYVV